MAALVVSKYQRPMTSESRHNLFNDNDNDFLPMMIMKSLTPCLSKNVIRLRILIVYLPYFFQSGNFHSNKIILKNLLNSNKMFAGTLKHMFHAEYTETYR